MNPYRMTIVTIALLVYAPNLSVATAETPSSVMETRKRLHEIQQACENYQNEYGLLPGGTLNDLIQILRGEDHMRQNPRKIQFLRFDYSSGHLWWLKKGELNRSNEPIDAWNQPLRMRRNLDGSIDIWSIGDPRPGVWAKEIRTTITDTTKH